MNKNTSKQSRKKITRGRVFIGAGGLAAAGVGGVALMATIGPRIDGPVTDKDVESTNATNRLAIPQLIDTSDGEVNLDV